jgi:hypothetical protein
MSDDEWSDTSIADASDDDLEADPSDDDVDITAAADALCVASPLFASAWAAWTGWVHRAWELHLADVELTAVKDAHPPLLERWQVWDALRHTLRDCEMTFAANISVAASDPSRLDAGELDGWYRRFDRLQQSLASALTNLLVAEHEECGGCAVANAQNLKRYLDGIENVDTLP